MRGIIPVVLFLAVLLAGCGSGVRVRVVDGDVAAAIAATVAAIDDGDQAMKFQTAAEVLALHGAATATTPAAQKSAAVAAIDGKTPAAILAAYDRLGPDLQAKYSAQLLAVWGLKRDNDALERAIDSAEFRDNPAYAAAVRSARQRQQAERHANGWLADQLASPTAEFIAKFGPPAAD